MRGDGVYWERVEGGSQNRVTSSLVFVSEASKALEVSLSGTKNGRIICEGGTEGVVTDRVRSLPL